MGSYSYPLCLHSYLKDFSLRAKAPVFGNFMIKVLSVTYCALIPLKAEAALYLLK